MPSLDLKYSADLNIDTKKLFKAVEDTVKAHDAGTGACKARAYPAQQFQYTHCYMELALLTKDSRDEAWTQKLIDDLEELLKAELTKASATTSATIGEGKQTAWGVNVSYASPYFRFGKIG